MKILTMKAASFHYNNMMPHCNGTEKTLINCSSPELYIISTCYYLLVECRDLPNSTPYIMSSTQTSVITPSNTPLPTDMSSTPTVQHTIQTPVITTSKTPTEMSCKESSVEDGGVPIAVVAGVIGALVVIIIGLILLVVVLIVVLSQKNSMNFRYIMHLH